MYKIEAVVNGKRHSYEFRREDFARSFADGMLTGVKRHSGDITIFLLKETGSKGVYELLDIIE